MNARTNEDTPQGLAFAITAYVLWGFLPLFMKLLSHVPPAEVVAHRVIWSLPIALAVLIWLGRTRDLWAALRSPRMLGMACITAALVSLNWGFYVWAIVNDLALDAALGYFMNPLFSVALGALVLREALTRAQLVAIGLAAIAVVVLVSDGGRVPWAAFGMMLTWGLYALGKKSLPIGPNQGFVLEVLILMPLSLMYVAYVFGTGASSFDPTLSGDLWLMLGCGVVTAVPLMIYANGAKLLRLSTIGILQYIAPTLIFLVAVFIFDEPFGRARAIAFPLIWVSLIIYTTSMIRGMRRA